PFDIEALTTLGVSVKSEGSIGYFGTGFKFALATLLRTGHLVTIHTPNESYRFTALTRNIRGQDFQLIQMNGVSLGFTTEFGKNWEMWMAFRELHSNTLDEGGWTSESRGDAQVVIEIAGAAYTEAYHKRHEIFLNL